MIRHNAELKMVLKGAKRSLYVRYTVKWVDWDNSVVPVKIYIFDVTNAWKRWNAFLDTKILVH